MRYALIFAASLAVLFNERSLAQQLPSNAYERVIRDFNRSLDQRQREIQEKDQRDFETNLRYGAPRTQRMPGEPRPGCPVGSAGC